MTRRWLMLLARLGAVLLPAVLLLSALTAPAGAQSCSVPGSHATLQAAVDDASCSTLTLVAQDYAESIYIPRSLTLAGPGAGGAVIQGLVRAQGSGTQLTLVDLAVANGCSPNALSAVSGAEITGTDLSVERSSALPCPPTADRTFADGFESGNTMAWSSTTP